MSNEMNNEKKRIVVCISDKENKNLKDKMEYDILEDGGEGSGGGGDKFRPRGFVSIIDKDSGEYLIKDKECEFGGTGKDNLIVWRGREIIPQILFNKDRSQNSGESQLRVYWLSIGTGGADPVDVLSPISPNTANIALANEIIIDANNPNYANGGRKKPFDSISFEQDPENNNKYLVLKITTTIKYEEANINDLNEAALWFSNSNNPLQANVFHLFARVTFSTIRKYNQRELVFLWYIYF